jgi:hypothetical protein
VAEGGRGQGGGRTSDGHRDDEGTRARDDYERQRAVQPPVARRVAVVVAVPLAPAERHCGEQQGRADHGEGVPFGKALEQLLPTPFVGLRVRHELR